MDREQSREQVVVPIMSGKRRRQAPQAAKGGTPTGPVADIVRQDIKLSDIVNDLVKSEKSQPSSGLNETQQRFRTWLKKHRPS